MTASKCYVWRWLPGATEPVVAGELRFDAKGRQSFVHGRSYLERGNAGPIYEPELPLRPGAHEPIDGLDHFSCLRDAAPDAWGRRVIENRLFGRKERAAGEDVDVVARILFDRVAPKIIDEFGEIGSEAHELAWRNVHLFVASLSHRNGGEALADLIEELGEEGAGDFMGKVFQTIGRTEGDAGAMDAIYFGNMMAYGKKQKLFSGYGANPGKYTADLLLDRLLDVTSVNPRFISSGNRIAKSEKRGVRVGLVGLMSNTKDASARGFRLELDAAWTLKNKKNGSLKNMGWIVKQTDGTTDMDIVAALQGRLYAVQVKASGSEFTTKSLGRWANLACKHVDKTITNPAVDDILTNVKFMFPPGPGDRVNDVATALIKVPPFAQRTIPQIEQLLVQKGCLIEIDVPGL